jgi:hypothetical protein
VLAVDPLAARVDALGVPHPTIPATSASRASAACTLASKPRAHAYPHALPQFPGCHQSISHTTIGRLCTHTNRTPGQGSPRSAPTRPRDTYASHYAIRCRHTQWTSPLPKGHPTAPATHTGPFDRRKRTSSESGHGVRAQITPRPSTSRLTYSRDRHRTRPRTLHHLARTLRQPRQLAMWASFASHYLDVPSAVLASPAWRTSHSTNVTHGESPHHHYQPASLADPSRTHCAPLHQHLTGQAYTTTPAAP